MSFALLYRSSTPHAERWRSGLERLIPDLDFRTYPEIGKPEDVRAALVWNPPHGLLASLPNLGLVISLGAGVDHILNDPHLPHDVPVVRLVDPHMVVQMSEYVVMQVLRLYRQDLAYAEQRREKVWRELPQKPPGEWRIGILGLGQYGSDAALKLKAFGFDVAGWSRRPKTIEGVRCYDGAAGLTAMLARTDILICLLPLTPETTGILDARAFAALPQGASIINVGRGSHLVEADLVAALDSGHLYAAVLDVFSEEPLPAASPIWSHKRIIMTPHIAAATNPPTAVAIVADHIHRLRDGRTLQHVVDRERRY
jgi:glyoxylate/hydroxypyruvate reductase A